MPDNTLSERLKERATLWVFEDLSPREKKSFEQLLEKSEQLRMYVDELTAAVEAVSQLESRVPSESFLKRQRNLLRGRIAVLETEPVYVTSLMRVKDAFSSVGEFLLFPRRPALAMVTYLLIGLLAGRFLLVPSRTVDVQAVPTMTLEEKIQRLMEAGQLAKTDIHPLGNGTDKVAFRLKAEDEFTYTGGVKDETVRELLAYLLLNEENPGKRLRSLKLMSDFDPDEELKMVLVEALLSDENPGVRLRAIKNLANYDVDKTIRDASIKTVLEDENTAIRMEALKILATDPDERLVPVLQVVSRLDDNEFIREEAAAMLEQIGESSDAQSIEEFE